jgi:hypothetical protein
MSDDAKPDAGTDPKTMTFEAVLSELRSYESGDGIGGTADRGASRAPAAALAPSRRADQIVRRQAIHTACSIGGPHGEYRHHCRTGPARS